MLGKLYWDIKEKVGQRRFKFSAPILRGAHLRFAKTPALTLAAFALAIANWCA